MTKAQDFQKICDAFISHKSHVESWINDDDSVVFDISNRLYWLQVNFNDTMLSWALCKFDAFDRNYELVAEYKDLDFRNFNSLTEVFEKYF